MKWNERVFFHCSQQIFLYPPKARKIFFSNEYTIIWCPIWYSPCISDEIWQHNSLAALVQVIACFLMTLSYYPMLNYYCWHPVTPILALCIISIKVRVILFMYYQLIEWQEVNVFALFQLSQTISVSCVFTAPQTNNSNWSLISCSQQQEIELVLF